MKLDRAGRSIHARETSDVPSYSNLLVTVVIVANCEPGRPDDLWIINRSDRGSIVRATNGATGTTRVAAVPPLTQVTIFWTGTEDVTGGSFEVLDEQCAVVSRFEFGPGAHHLLVLPDGPVALDDFEGHEREMASPYPAPGSVLPEATVCAPFRLDSRDPRSVAWGRERRDTRLGA